MEYYVNSKGEITGRLYEVRNGWAAEIGRQAENVSFGFFATRSIKCVTHRQAEKFLLENGCVAAAVA